MGVGLVFMLDILLLDEQSPLQDLPLFFFLMNGQLEAPTLACWPDNSVLIELQFLSHNCD